MTVMCQQHRTVITSCLTQVRRKADGAKNLVKQWLTDWRDSPLVTQDPSHTQIQGTLGMWAELDLPGLRS